MRFPESEIKVAALAFKVANGMQQAPDDFPHPPVSPEALLALHAKYFELRQKIMFAEAALHELHLEKDAVYDEMKESTKANLRFGEIKARRHPEKLVILGWGPPREKKRLGVPGEVRNIAVGAQEETSVELSWRPPLDGGAVAAYQIQQRIARGKWENVQTLAGLEAKLEDQPRGVELEYRVKGVNRAGEGQESATVSVVL